MKRNYSGSLKLIIVLVIAFLLLRGCSEAGSSPYGVLMGFVSFAFWSGLVVCLIVLAITAAVIWFTVKDKKYRGKHDPPNVTPQAAREAAEAKAKARAEAERAKAAAGADAANAGGARTDGTANASGADQGGQAGGQNAAGNIRPENASVADRSKVYEKTPEGIRQMLSDYRIDCILGSVAADALKQKDRLETQQQSYRRLVERRFGKGTLSAEKYLAVEKSSNDALQNSYLRIANRMEAFDTREYLRFTSGEYKKDSIPDQVQEQRFEIYQENLHYMKDCLADNEHILAGMDRLMLKLADSDSTDETGITEEINALEEQLAYYKKQH